ncbi:MAG: DUF3231 family protein [Firmicutes bacterium]|nr:DUF3231 family protein [Bacillota bacterium]
MRIKELLHIQKKPEAKSQNVDIREAFCLWDILNSKYTTMEKLVIYNALAHDADLKLMLKKMESDLEKSIGILHRQLKKYNIISPNKNRVAAPSPASSELMNDEFIAMGMLLYLQEHIENLVISLYSIVTNDEVREVISDMLLRTVKNADDFMKYVALRGWAGTPPAYRNLPANTKEKINCGEAGCLWDMLTYRYDTLHFTEVMTSVIHDTELKAILAAGIQMLKKQIEQIEKELIHFGIPLPKRPADITIALDNKDLWEDSHIYRMVLRGMQGAGTLHVRSFKNMFSNHRLRGFIVSLLKQEIEKIDDFIRYGKLKGWLHPVPKYGS